MSKNNPNYIRALINDYCVLDTETTGLSAEYDDVIEIALLRVRDNEIVDRYTQLIHPSWEYLDDEEDEITDEDLAGVSEQNRNLVKRILELSKEANAEDEDNNDYKDDDDIFEDNGRHLIDPFITSLTGITDDMVKDAPYLEDVEKDVLAFIGNDVILGHHTSFDIRFLNAGFKQKIENKYMDTMHFARKVYPSLESHSLAFLSEYLGLSRSTHRALADCIATKDLYDNLKAYMVENNLKISDLWKVNKFDISSIKTQTDDFEVDNLFFGKHVVFTGVLDSMPRKNAMQMVVDVGGILDHGVTKKTNFLVLGSTDYNHSLRGAKSSKHKKAEQLKLKGQDIEIIDESTFLAELLFSGIDKDD